ncbi:MAG TPA: hypothetical protein PL029_08070 [Bacteroidia bacterium]|nr:hypothetical protein [Bacteroidia bacterium]
MKLLISLCTLVLIFSSCAQRFTLKGSYRDHPYPIPTTKSTEETWLQVMDFLVQEKLTPQLLKKKKSLVVTDYMSFKDTYTVEDAKGALVDSTKYVVLPEMKNGAEPLITATGYWTIKVHSHKNKTAVTIDLSKVTAVYDSKEKTTKLIGNKVSTGQFEKKLQAFLHK